jgi:hypothetical protein
MTRLSVGGRVIDTDDDDPNVGVVVARPLEKTIADRKISTNNGTTTAVEMNPEYPADSQLVIIAFKSALNGCWSKCTRQNQQTSSRAFVRMRFIIMGFQRPVSAHQRGIDWRQSEE